MRLKPLPGTQADTLTGFQPARTASLGLLLCLAVSLMACTPIRHTGSAPVYTSSPTVTDKTDRQTETSPEQTKDSEQTKELEQSAYKITPSTTAVNPAQKAVKSLTEEAWKHYHNDDPDKAIAVAERAQRLDSRSAEVYLVLASSYVIQGKQQLAEQFARRGLSYSAVGSVLRRRLQELLGQVTTLQ